MTTGGRVFGEGFNRTLADARRDGEVAWARLYPGLAPLLTGSLAGRRAGSPAGATDDERLGRFVPPRTFEAETVSHLAPTELGHLLPATGRPKRAARTATRSGRWTAGASARSGRALRARRTRGAGRARSPREMAQFTPLDQEPAGPAVRQFLWRPRARPAQNVRVADCGPGLGAPDPAGGATRDDGAGSAKGTLARHRGPG